MKLTREIVLEIIKYTIKCHPPECIFRPDTEEFILEYMKDCMELENTKINNKIQISEMVYAFTLCEIYCPHEGIDRRKEFGIVPVA